MGSPEVRFTRWPRTGGCDGADIDLVFRAEGAVTRTERAGWLAEAEGAGYEVLFRESAVPEQPRFYTAASYEAAIDVAKGVLANA